MAKSLKDTLQRKKKEGQRTEDLAKEQELIKTFTPAKPMSLADRNRQAAARESAPEPGKWTSEQVDKWTSEQASAHLSEQLSEQQSKCTSEQLSEQQSKCTSAQQNNRTTEQAHNRTSAQQNNRASEQAAAPPPAKKAHDLKYNQLHILREIYFNRPFKVSGPDRVGKNIAYGTVRNCLKSLHRKGYITKPFSINDGVNMGTTCQVDESKCIPLFGPTPIINSEQVNNRTTAQVSNRTSEQQDNRATEQVSNSTSAQVASSNSSSSFNNNLLLAGARANEIETALENNPDLAYWKRQNLKARKVELWMADTGMSLEEMIESLIHCAFEMVQGEGKDKKGNPITSAFDWFWRRIEKHRYYDKPTGYISTEERKLERARKRLAEKEALAKELARIRTAEEQADLEVRFEEMMKNPEGELYRRCHEGMNSFQRSRAKTQKGLSIAMRREFDKIMAKEAEGDAAALNH